MFKFVDSLYKVTSISSQIETTGGAYFDTFAYAVNENIQKNLAMLNQLVDRDQWLDFNNADNYVNFTTTLYRWLAALTEVNAFYYPPLNKIGMLLTSWLLAEFKQGINLL